MIDFSPLPWGEGGESSEPGEGFLPTEPRDFGIRIEPSRPQASCHSEQTTLLVSPAHRTTTIQGKLFVLSINK
jgi:hypothetical protein